MHPIQGAACEIHEPARDEVRPESFAGILYPNCIIPVEFVEYRQVDANAAFRRVGG